MAKRKIIIECDDITAKETAEVAIGLQKLVTGSRKNKPQHIFVEGLTVRQGNLFLPDWKTYNV